MNPREIKIADYTYHLPNERIAIYPLEERDSSKLLIYKNGEISQDIYKNIATHIPENSLLIFNNTKVIEARILFEKSEQRPIEIFCLEPSERIDITNAMLQKSGVKWNCFIGGAARWKSGILEKQIINNGIKFNLTCEKIEKKDNYFIVEFNWDNLNLCFAEVLHFAGIIPLPPYLNRAANENDYERYQTVYAQNTGSVAAPTAGLHFTNEVLESFKIKNIQKNFVTLHVGSGTFKPVKSETLNDHDMHSEWINVSKQLIENLIEQNNEPIIAVGTTSLRTIESLYWMGIKASQNPNTTILEIEIKQWDVYEVINNNLSKKDALSSLLNWMKMNKLEQIIIPTQIIITPSYSLKVADAIVTNFHQPNSTLLLLIAAIIGDDWRTIYNFALNNEYRFLSYGDGSLLWNKK
jgi:S-adenosylmethionine:tRNA ribosyltransferase-isomerase